jgi:MarR family transcriptional regulator, transcriptional regulator for hemolysin
MSRLDAIVRENIRIMAQVITEICQRSTRKEVSESPLSRNQYYILNILAQSGEQLISDLARILDISAAATSKNVDRLEQLDMVERKVGKNDRRSYEIHLRPQGRHVIDRFNEITAKKQIAVMAQFSEEEKIQLLDFLKRIVQYTLNDSHDADLICLQCGGRCGDDCVVDSGKGKCPSHESIINPLT